jgi:2'-5' RNA ligase
MRLFVGVFPDEQTRGYFRDIRQLLSKYKRNFRFTPIDQIHMTIKFLGNDVNYEVYEEYAQALKDNLAEAKRISYQIGDLQFGFPGQLMPDVLFTNVNNNSELNDLTTLCADIAKNYGKYSIVSKKEHKKLIHHFTLARLKSGISKAFGRNFEEVLENLPKPNFESTASEIVLVESNLTDQGPVYKITDRISLN